MKVRSHNFTVGHLDVPCLNLSYLINYVQINWQIVLLIYVLKKDMRNKKY